MNTTNLTGDAFWEKYWRDKESAFNLVVADNYLYADVIQTYIPKGINSFMEIGGFPGYFSVLFKKLYGVEAKLCDTYIDERAINALCKANHIDSIKAIKEDIFKLETEKVDVVLSAGLIEHFSNPADIINKHFDFLNDRGYAIIGVPNFLGLNGLLQRLMDNSLYRAHNLDAMRFSTLIDACHANNAEILYIGYYGKFALWLEDISKRSFVTRACLKLVNKMRNFIWFESKIFSPFIICIARKL